MVESIIAFFAGLPAPLATTILSALPIVELRLTIPVAIHEWSMTPGLAFGCGVVGALLPFLPLYFGLMKLRGWCERNFPRLVAPIDRVIAHGGRKLDAAYNRYGTLALFLLAAIPLPLAGVWSASVAAVALKIPFKQTAIGMVLGTIVAGLIVTALSVTADVVLQ